jgi:hypothetical protein
MMKFGRIVSLVAFGAVIAACSQGNSDNVMAPQSNALTPAEVNAALGPETQVVPDNNMLGTDTNGIGQQDTSSPAVTESAANNAE